MANNLVYTKKKPKESGWYWVKYYNQMDDDTEEDVLFLVCEKDATGKDCLFFLGQQGEYNEWAIKSLYAKIPNPKTPPGADDYLR